MSKFSWFGLVMSLVLLLGGTVALADDPAATEWQAVIAGQIQAFRDHDAPAALSFASAEFHKTFPDPNDFFIAIINSGYTPIMTSRSQTFGPYQLVAPDKVLQEVKLTGNDQNIYEAVYQLSKEADGWRVHSVQLVKVPGLGV
ncbi:MAG: DUF4864 domain-containing protein [Devosia sp.]